MKDTLIKAIIFVGGAALGSLTTWKIVKTKYEQISKEEIESVKKTFKAEYDISDLEPADTIEADKIEEEAAQILQECNDIIEKADYTKYSGVTGMDAKKYEEEKGGSDDMVYDKPYVIAPEDFGELDGYEQISLTYFEDGVLTDDNYNLVDVDLVGADFHIHFGEYEDDSVFVRNDTTKCDYEILADTRYYTDVVPK